MRFAGKVAIVTGASTGLGPIMAQLLASEGASVILAARRGELVAAEAAKIGASAIAVEADVTCEGDVARMVEVAMARWGQVDILMNNAAVSGEDRFIWEQTLENWNNTFAVDVTAAMLCSREVLNRSMLARKSGVIINFSTGASWDGLPRKSHYSSAKAALRVLTKVIAKEVGVHGIRCNCVVPGAIDTALMQNYMARIAAEQGVGADEIRAQLTAAFPLKTFSTPEDVANLALFLASDAARTITGQSINVDAGQFMT